MRKPSLIVIFLTVFIDLIGFGIVLPLLPRYSEKFGAGGFLIGLIIASFSAMQFLLSPAWGRLSDRIGRRPVLLISNFGSVISYGLFALAAWPGFSADAAVTVLLVSRVFAGACGANLSVATAYIADITAPEHRSKSMGLIGVAFGLGFILGPALGAFSVKYMGLAGPGWVASALCAANFVLACFILVESRQPGSAHASERPKMAQWGHILRRPKVGLLIGLYALSTFSFACYESTLPLLLGSPLFHADDFKDARTLAGKINQGADPVSQRLRSQCSSPFLLQAAGTNAPERTLRKLLYHELNRQIKSAGLFDADLRKQILLQAAGTNLYRLILLRPPGTNAPERTLRKLLNQELKRQIESAELVDVALRKLIYQELNRQIQSAELLDQGLRMLILDQATGTNFHELISRGPENQVPAVAPVRADAVKRLNRLLLEDAYPAEIERQHVYYDEQRIGYLFAYCGLVSVFIQGGVIGRLVKRFGERKVILGSLVIIAVSLVFLPYAQSLAGLLVWLGAFSVGAGINRAPTMGLLSVYSDPAEQGATMGVAQSAGTLARILAPVLATTLFVVSPHSPYFFAAAVAGLAALIALRHLFKEERKP